MRGLVDLLNRSCLVRNPALALRLKCLAGHLQLTGMLAYHKSLSRLYQWYQVLSKAIWYPKGSSIRGSTARGHLLRRSPPYSRTGNPSPLAAYMCPAIAKDCGPLGHPDVGLVRPEQQFKARKGREVMASRSLRDRLASEG